MEEARRKELDDKLQKLSELVSSVQSELYDVSELYYEQGNIYNTLNNMALDCNELYHKLNSGLLLEDTVTGKICGENKEFAIGDSVGYMKMNGQIYSGRITELFEGDNESDVVFDIADDRTEKDMGAYHIRRIISWDSYYDFYLKKWNKFVEKLYEQKKSVSLSQQNGLFNLKAINHTTGAEYHRDGLHIKDFDNDLFNKIEEL